MKMCIYGDWMARVVSQNLFIVLSSMEQSLLSIGVDYGNPGLHQNAKFFFDSPSGTGARQWTDLSGEAFRIHPSVHYVTRRKKTFNICSHVCSPGISSSGFLHLWAYKIGFQVVMNCLLQIWWRKAVKKVQKDKKTKG
jgi:hypothetical protein